MPSAPTTSSPNSLSISSRTFTLSPLPPSSSSTVPRSSRAARRVHIASEVLKASRVNAGDPLLVAGALRAEELSRRLKIRDETGDEGRAKGAGKDPVALAYAWPSFTLDKNHVACSSTILTDGTLEYGDVVSLSPVPPSFVHDADKVILKVLPVQGNAGESKKQKKQKSDMSNKRPDSSPIKGGSIQGKLRPAFGSDETLEALFTETLHDLKCVMLSQTLEVTLEDGVTRKARVQDVRIDNKPAPRGVYVICEDTEVDVQLPAKANKRDELVPSLIDQTGRGLIGGYDAVGGLDRHIASIRELVELPLTRPELYAHFSLKPPRGILLHGPPGTGKTLLASSIAASLRLPLFNVDGPSLSSPYHGETEQRLREVFEQAEECAPSLIVIDEVDALVPAREDSGEVERRVVATLLTLMDGLGSKESSQQYDDADSNDANPNKGRVIVIACTNRPNAIDQALRRPGRFDKEIEIGVPDADARLSILRVLLRRTPHALPESLLHEIAGKTHGYVGADLSSLVHSAGLNAIRRITTSTGNQPTLPDHPSPPPPLNGDNAAVQQQSTERVLLPSDISAALLSTRPSALRSVFLETPQVSWSDIGGQSLVKAKLQEVISWPLLHPETFKRLGVAPPRGILLYGPPGCSKTLIAKALASSAGTNFISLKGPEVFNKYVGESEKTIRETFRKARAAAPCIVFLDEVDVIAASREEGGEGMGERILTTLLTEMDGIEELNGVTILAATNRPDVIDSALMRPGRLDRILYVAPPDRQARVDIFNVNFERMAVHEDVDVAKLADVTDGCSGAEIVSICQDAAFNAMNEDLDAMNIRMEHLAEAATNMRRRITPEVIQFYEEWRDSSGVREV